MLKELEARIAEINNAIEKSFANHNFLMGALNEVKKLHALYTAVSAAVPSVAELVPVLNAVLPEIEAGIEAVQAIQDVVEPVAQPAANS
jgi:hypothetical protein